jgi:hypothetical protein
MQPIFENRGRSVIDILRKKNTDEKQEREIRGFEWLGESLLSLGVQDPIVFEVGHAFASRQPVLESKVDSAARILSTYNTPQSPMFIRPGASARTDASMPRKNG